MDSDGWFKKVKAHLRTHTWASIHWAGIYTTLSLSIDVWWSLSQCVLINYNFWNPRTYSRELHNYNITNKQKQKKIYLLIYFNLILISLLSISFVNNTVPLSLHTLPFKHTLFFPHFPLFFPSYPLSLSLSKSTSIPREHAWMSRER